MALTKEQRDAYAAKKAGFKAKARAKGPMTEAQYKKYKWRKGTAKMYGRYGNGYQYKPKKDEGIISAFNNGIKGLGNTLATNMLGSIPGLSTITGHGDYYVKSNSLMNSRGPGVPQFRGSRSVYVRHREYIGDVISGAANSFDIKQYTINPGLAATFPWLANVAQQYDEYKIRGMVFEFVSCSADALNSTNTALGQVIMATQYNVLSAPFSNKQQMENYQFGCSTRPSASLMHPIECEPHQTPLTELYVRTLANQVSTGDARLYDFGNFFIATNGLQAANVNLGELWVSYDIQLFKPRLGPQIQLNDHYRCNGTVTTANYLGTTPIKQSSSSFGTSWNGTDTLTIPNGYSGNLLLEWNVTGTGVTPVFPTFTTSASITTINLFNSNGASRITGQSQTGGSLTVTASFKVLGGGTIQFVGGTLPTAITAGDLFVLATSLSD